MMRGCFRVSPMGTDVMGIALRPVGALARCVSVADTSLSLSLSLSTPGLLGKKPSLGAQSGAHNDLLAGIHRPPGCGVRRSPRAHGSLVSCAPRGSVLRARGLFERRCRVPHLAVAFEKAPSRAPTRDGSSSAERRGSHKGPRRSPIACCLTAVGKFLLCFAPSRVSPYNTRGALPSFLEETVR